MDQESPPVREGHGYNPLRYDHLARFISYWHQIDEVLKLSGGDQNKSILEIGPGNYVSSAQNLPLRDGSFDLVVAFQVLEHLPFSLFAPSLQEMGRVAREHLLFSVPDARYFFGLNGCLFSAGRLWRLSFSLPRLTKRVLPRPKPGGHQWEIGRAGFSLSRIITQIPDPLRLKRHCRIPGNPFHHSFVLEASPS
ncbi:MAG: class I SAM-dependent methyltransferase [Deltaproteobacteria bacterium]|nr:class I SAM-dependent methyltransferase [Deltaproteobacteria bacterium]